MAVSIKPTPLYLNPGLKASLSAPSASSATFEEYISDPAKPVPFRARPIDATSWSRWLVDDQREQVRSSRRVGLQTEVLTAPVKISGQADLLI